MHILSPLTQNHRYLYVWLFTTLVKMAKVEYNLRSPAVKRLLKEAKELKDPTPQYSARPLEDNLFEWHFTILGPADTPFEGGRYHGRVVLPSDYPMKPPSILMLTPNGRFELNKKICLSMSAYHPELWQPSWSIRTALLAIIGFMPTESGGAVGALDYPEDEKRRLAKLSTDWCCPVCGVCNRTALAEGDLDDRVQAEAADIAKQMSFKSETEIKAAVEALKKKGGGSSEEEQQEEESGEGGAHEGSGQDQTDVPHNSSPASGGGVRQRQTGHPQEARNVQASLAPPRRLPLTPPHPIPQPKGTTSLVVMWLLILMIFLLVGRRAYLSYSGETLKNFHP